MRRIFFLSAALLTAAAAPAWALSLDEAKQMGYVGERADGYVGVVSPKAPAEARDLVNQINAARREKYQGVAKRHNTDPRAVEAIAGKRLLDQTPSGTFVMDGAGAWRKK